QTGPDIAVAAMGGGHWASESIHAWLTTGVAKRPFEYDVVQKDLTSADFAHVERTHQEHPHHDAPEARLAPDRAFQEFNHGLTPEQCKTDAARCMECGCGDLFECKLRRYAQQYEVNPDRVAGAHVAGVQEVNSSYVRNMDKCILCGRCVRVCDELAGFHAIDFTRRGFEGSVDAAFWRGTEGTECTQCGLCVQLCPVGALMEKRAPRKPHSEIPQIMKTACGRCGLGCQLELNLDADRRRVVRVTTDFDDPTSVSGGNSCARGRFGDEAVAEKRLAEPRFRGEEGRWNTLLDDLGGKLKGVLDASGGSAVAVVAGGSLGNEEYLALQRLVTEALPGALLAVEGVDAFAPARQVLETAWKTPLGGATYADVRHADAYLLLESDTDRTHPVLTSWMRGAMRKNHAAVVYIGQDAGKLDRGDALVLSPREGTREDLLRGLSVAALQAAGRTVPDGWAEYTPLKTAALTGVDEKIIEGAAHALAKAKRLVTLVGAPVGSSGGAMEIVTTLLGILGARRVMLLHEGANVVGAALLNVASASVADVVGALRGGDIKALLTVGVDPAALGMNDDDLKGLAISAALSTERLTTSPDYVLPMADWREREGRAFTLAGVQVEQVRAIPAPGLAVELCWTVAALARRLGREIPVRIPLVSAGR
ncbi:MAG TPA: molybdopterin-dependent oxidoreductase, partial [Synergistaceae bacterium]|nr:molybdopterin-dependent oxidoreductase [Synergistaceae bacterium]